MPTAPAVPTGEGAGRFAALYADLVVRLRWWVIAGWAVAAVGALLWLPNLGDSHGGDGLKALLSSETPAVATEKRSYAAFGFPLLARTALVQRDPDGLTPYDQARTVTNAVALSEHKYHDTGPIRGALPLTNAFSLFPASKERDTTAITYLFFDPKVSFSSQFRAARKYGNTHFTARDNVVGVTGSVPARVAQGGIIKDHLPLVEESTLAAILLIVGLAFRSVVAPVLTLGVTAVAYVLVLRLSGLVAQLVGVATPGELEPVVVAMLLGVVTDYVVFFFSALRNELARGHSTRDAVWLATARFGPIVAVAGLAVAAGTGALFAADSAFFKALGPALVFAILIALTVALTLVPAVMAVIGPRIFWPSRNLARQADRPVEPAAGDPEQAQPRRSRYVPGSRIAGDRRLAAVVMAGCIAVLLLAALPLSRLELGVSFVDALPADTGVRRSSLAAQTGFADGILSPTVVLVEGDQVATRRGRLAALGDELAAQPGVAGVLGPGTLPFNEEFGILLSRDRNAARYLVVLGDEPLGAAAITSVDAITARLPEMLRNSGLGGTTTEVTAGVGGDTATASYIVDQTERDLLRIAIAALLVNLLMLLLFLRAAVASAYLLGASLLSVSAALGLTTLVFDHVSPGEGLTFYVPFAAAVLLLAFGSDYNIFGVGHVWDEARHRPLAGALAAAMPGTARALTTAGMALAASFGLLALVPLLPFRQLAFAMAVGIFLDVFVVRLLLMPALLTVVGPVSAWPSGRLREGAPSPAAEGTPASGTAVP